MQSAGRSEPNTVAIAHVLCGETPAHHCAELTEERTVGLSSQLYAELEGAVWPSGTFELLESSAREHCEGNVVRA